MKKRILSLLLAVLMVVSCVAGMTVSAHADDEDVIDVTMRDGDTVLKICQANGINYFTCKNAIMQLNNILSDNDFRFIPVGKVIKIPASDEAGVQIIKSGATGTGSSAGTTTGTAQSVTLIENVAYYLIPHTIQRGETLRTVCSALGISFDNYANQIVKLNGLKNMNVLYAGQTLLFPTSVKPAVGVSCYKVLAHKVGNGESAYSICGNLGVSLNANLRLLQGLNNKDNLNYITANSTFYVPVPTVIQADPVNPVNPTSTPTASPTASPAKQYKLNVVASAGGVVNFSVGGKTVTTAAAGDVVKVIPTPNNGYAAISLDVVYANGTAKPNLVGDTFVMPAADISVNVEFAKGYDISVSCSYTNGVKVLVNGIEGSSATQGSDVYVASNNPSLSIDGKVEVYNANTGKLYKEVAVGSSFKMPGYPVIVKAVMKTVTTYGFYKSVVEADMSTPAPATGSFVLQVNGSTVSKAAEGTTVSVLASPSVGYSVSKIKVVEYDGKTEGGEIPTKNSQSFVMPAGSVKVLVSFSADTNKITINPASNGSIAASSVGNALKKISYAKTGDEVFIFENADAGYSSDAPVVTSTVDGTMVTVVAAGTKQIDGTSYTVYKFVMPGGGATVTAQFVGADHSFELKMVDTDGKELPTNSDCSIKINNVAAKSKYGVGEILYIDPVVGYRYEFVKYEVYNDNTYADTAYNAELSMQANNGCITMPDANVYVKSVFKAIRVEVGSLFRDDYIIFFVDANNWNLPVDSVLVNEKITMLVFSGTGDVNDIKSVKVWNIVTGQPIILTPGAEPYVYNNQLAMAYTFTVPAEGVDIEVEMNDAPKAMVFNAPSSMTVLDYDGSTMAAADWDMFIRLSQHGTFDQDVPAAGLNRNIIAGTEFSIQLSDKAQSMGYYIKSVTLTYDGTDHYFETHNNCVTTTMPKSAVILSKVVLGKGGIGTGSFDTKLDNCWIAYYDASDATKQVGGYVVGDTVRFKLTANYGYTVDPASVKIMDLDTGLEDSAAVTYEGNGYYSFKLLKSHIRIIAEAYNDLHSVHFTNFADEEKIKVNIVGNEWNIEDASNNNNIYQARKDWTVSVYVPEGVNRVPTVIGLDVVNDGNGRYHFTMPDNNVQVTFVTA